MYSHRQVDLQWFTENRDGLRKQAPLNGMCSRCVVRRARSGKKYCQRCTDYEKRYARQRKQQRLKYAVGSRDVGESRDKVMKIAEYGIPARRLEQPPPREHYRPLRAEAESRGYVSEPVRSSAAQRDEQFADLARTGAMGAAVLLQNPVPVPLGLNPFYDDI